VLDWLATLEREVPIDEDPEVAAVWMLQRAAQRVRLGWCRGAPALDAAGERVWAGDPRARRWPASCSPRGGARPST
jgi:hypothetical protein